MPSKWIKKKFILEWNYHISLSSFKPTFNYASFCKVLSIHHINYEIRLLLKKPSPSYSINNDVHLVAGEIFKFLLTQISLRSIDVFLFAIHSSIFFLTSRSDRLFKKYHRIIYLFKYSSWIFLSVISNMSYNIWT